MKQNNRSGQNHYRFWFFIANGGILMDKKRLRTTMLTLLNKIDWAEYNQLSQTITEHLLFSAEFLSAKTIGLTISRFPEVNTMPLIETAWKMGKQIVVPKCDSATREMDFRRITSFDQLEKVYMDLLEPIVAKTEAVAQQEIDLQIVPGVVYSNEGYRIGFGGGYYDRYLQGFAGDTVSLAFDCQVGHDVPVEIHDIGVDAIFTEKRLIICRKGEQL